MRIDPRAKGCLTFGCGGLLLGTALVIALPVLILNFSGLDDEAQAAATEAKAGLDRAAQAVEAAESEYSSFQQSAEFASLSDYAERDNWQGLNQEARSLLSAAQRVYDEEAQPIIDRDKLAESDSLKQAVAKLNPMIAAARDAAPRWRQRKDRVVAAREDPDAVANGCAANMKLIQEQVTSLKAMADRARTQYTDAAAEIASMLAPIEQSSLEAAEAGKIGQAEYAKHSAGDADYLALANSCGTVQDSAEALSTRAPEVSARLAELDRSYSKTLVDMKADYALVIRRQSWDNAYDYPPLTDYDWTRTVDGATFDHFDNIPGSLAKISKGLFGTSVSLLSGVDQDRWNSLQINAEENMPARDDEAEIWLQEVKADYFHKYFVTEDGESSETDWVPVTEAFFLANLDNLGMDVESKPFGVFESDKLTEAAPPGLAFVGNERYGRWESDGRGGSVWNWIGPYLLYRSLFGSPYSYGRGEWDTWRGGYRGSRPYYGGTSTAPAWGTRGKNVQTSPRMQGSQFARGGGFQRAASSVRGAGPGSRGGGFGGSGK